MLIFSTFLLGLIAMLLVSQDTDLEAVARNVAQPAKRQLSSSVADLVFIPSVSDSYSFDPDPEF